MSTIFFFNNLNVEKKGQRAGSMDFKQEIHQNHSLEGWKVGDVFVFFFTLSHISCGTHCHRMWGTTKRCSMKKKKIFPVIHSANTGGAEQGAAGLCSESLKGCSPFLPEWVIQFHHTQMQKPFQWLWASFFCVLSIWSRQGEEFIVNSPQLPGLFWIWVIRKSKLAGEMVSSHLGSSMNS